MVRGRFRRHVPRSERQQGELYKRISAPSDGFLRIVPFTGCAFANYEYHTGVEFDMNYPFNLDNYQDRVSTELNKCLRHHAGKIMYNQRYGLKCDDMGWVAIEDVLANDPIWKHYERSPRTYLVRRGYGGRPDTWDAEEARFRMSLLMRVTFYCARWGRRVREQILAFGIPKDIDRMSQTCVQKTGSMLALRSPMTGPCCIQWRFVHQQVTPKR